MNKTTLQILLALGLATSAKAAALIALDAGILSTAAGAAIPDGALVQVVASTSDAVFSSPVTGSFVGGSLDDVVVASFAMNSATVGLAGAMSTTFQLQYGAGAYEGKTIVNGTPLLLRWWPQNSSLPTLRTPSGGESYGEFRATAIQDQATRGWTVPADGSTDNLKFLTSSVGGSNSDAAGRAVLTVVPEPSSAILALVGGLGWVARRRRR